MKKKIITVAKNQIDKVAHALLGTAFYAVSGLFTAALIALVTTIILAVAVEAYDKLSRKGTPDFWDILATIILPSLLYLGK